MSFLDPAAFGLHQRRELSIAVRGAQMFDHDVATVLPAGNLTAVAPDAVLSFRRNTTSGTVAV